MKTKFLLSIFALGLIVSAFSQKPTMELTFTAENNGQYVPLDSILIENLTQGGDTTLYAPDTVLVIDYVTSIGDNKAIGENTLAVSQNYPNPFKGKTEVNLYLPEKEHIKITVRDIVGRELAQYKSTLNRGNHSFAFYSGNEKYYLLTVTGKQSSKTIKMLNANGNTTYGRKCKIVYNDYGDNAIGFKSQKAINDFVFSLGDELEYTAFSNIGEKSIIDSPTGNQTYTFQYLIGIPCPGTPTVTYEGQVYNTVLIDDQCWLKEDLNVGTRINGSVSMSDNSTIEKYCYDDNEANCDTYGGLYQWDEMMQYTTTPGVQGICPPDWHLPTNEEWKILEGTVDSQYPVGDPEWNNTNWRGYDAGERLKSENDWNSGGNGTNLYGFTAFPMGYSDYAGVFNLLGDNSYFWSSTEATTYGSYSRMMKYDNSGVFLDSTWKTSGCAVRCVMD